MTTVIDSIIDFLLKGDLLEKGVLFGGTIAIRGYINTVFETIVEPTIDKHFGKVNDKKLTISFLEIHYGKFLHETITFILNIITVFIVYLILNSSNLKFIHQFVDDDNINI